MFWTVRDQKEDTEEEKEDGTSVLKNRTYMQNKSVITAGRNVCSKTVRFECWEEVGICRASSAFPKKGRLWRQAINLAPPRRVRAWRDELLRLEDAGLGAPDINADLPESMSDGLDRLPAEPRLSRPDPCTDHHDRPPLGRNLDICLCLTPDKT